MFSQLKKQLFICLVIISFISLPLFAQYNQDEVSSGEENESSFRTGNKALLFTFNGLEVLSTGNFEGGLGGKYFLTKNLNLRAGIEFNLIEEDIPTTQQGFDDESKTAIAFGVNLAVEYHLTDNRISPYIGLGAGIRVLGTHSETPSQNEERTNLPEEIDGRLYNPGVDVSLSVLAGVEFFLIENLSLATEYRIGFTNHTKLDGEITTNGNEASVEGSNLLKMNIENQGWLTLAFYF